MSRRIVSLDFTETGTAAALSMLQNMADDGEIAAMVFAIRLSRTSKRQRRRMFGATGRAADDIDIASGLSCALALSLTKEAVEE